MTKKTLAALELLFEDKVRAAINNSPPREVRPPRLAKAMIEDGLIVAGEVELPRTKQCPFPLTIKCHFLTERGRYLYCVHCGREP